MTMHDTTIPAGDGAWRPEGVPMRRYEGKLNGERYVGDPRSRQVHDLEREQSACGIDGLLEAGLEEPFGGLVEAHLEGYDGCPHCLGG